MGSLGVKLYHCCQCTPLCHIISQVIVGVALMTFVFSSWPVIVNIWAVCRYGFWYACKVVIALQDEGYIYIYCILKYICVYVYIYIHIYIYIYILVYMFGFMNQLDYSSWTCVEGTTQSVKIAVCPMLYAETSLIDPWSLDNFLSSMPVQSHRTD